MPNPISDVVARTVGDPYDEYEAYLSDADEGMAFSNHALDYGYNADGTLPNKGIVMEQVASPKTVAKVIPKSEVISDAQGKRFYAIAKKSGKSDQQIKDYIGSLGYEHTREIPWKLYKEACAWAEGA
jgi:hypothetical protein